MDATTDHVTSTLRAAATYPLSIAVLFIDMLSKEPPWCDGSNCYECAAKFGVTTRKHHW